MQKDVGYQRRRKRKPKKRKKKLQIQKNKDIIYQKIKKTKVFL